MSGDILSGDGDLCFGKHLYHVKRTIAHPAQSPSDAVSYTDVQGTFTDRKSAEQAAREALFAEGYERNRFTIFEIRESNTPLQEWKYGDGVYVFAVAPEGEVFTVAVDTTENDMGLERNGCRKTEWPSWYVLETTLHSKAHGDRPARVCGMYRTHKSARAAALHWLLRDGTTRADFATFEVADQMSRLWPAQVVVRAVGHDGEICTVSVVRQQVQG